MQICSKCIQGLLKTGFERKHGNAVLIYTKRIVTYTVADYFLCLP